MITTNTGAKKLESSDNWREIFPNSTLGTAGAHNASVDAADRIQPEIAPIINGKQCALGAAKDDYVLLRNSTITGKSDGAYIAAKAIPANTDIDSTYLGNAITGGISNSINSKITQIGIIERGSISTISVPNNTETVLKTIALSAGQYLIYYKADFATTNATGIRALGSKIDNESSTYRQTTNGVNGVWVSISVTEPVKLNASANFKIIVNHTLGSNMNIGGYYSVVRLA